MGGPPTVFQISHGYHEPSLRSDSGWTDAQTDIGGFNIPHMGQDPLGNNYINITRLFILFLSNHHHI